MSSWSQQMCDKSVADYVAVLKFALNWFVANKMIKGLVNTLYADENILYFNKSFSNVEFSCNEMGLV